MHRSVELMLYFSLSTCRRVFELQPVKRKFILESGDLKKSAIFLANFELRVDCTDYNSMIQIILSTHVIRLFS